MLLVVTANCGTLGKEHLRERMRYIEQLVAEQGEALVFFALFFQELGGDTKDVHLVQEMDQVLNEWVSLKDFCSTGILFNANPKSEYTALGSVFFVRKCHMEHVQVLDRRLGEMVSMEGLLTVAHGQSRFESFCQTERMQGSRKGFLRTSFRIGHHALELINVHFPADASNLVAKGDDSEYAQIREQCLLRTMKECKLQGHLDSTKAIVAGDFNFRLDLKSLWAAWGREHDLVESKYFRCEAVDDALRRKAWKSLRAFDKEPNNGLFEFERVFAPTYCTRADNTYDSKRCPAWPDRVLVSPGLKSAIASQEYNSRVWNCDHHLVYLSFQLGPAKSADSQMNHPRDAELDRNGKLIGIDTENDEHPRRRRGPNVLFQVAPVALAVLGVVAAYIVWKRSL